MSRPLFLKPKIILMAFGLWCAVGVCSNMVAASESPAKVVVIAPIKTAHELLDKGLIDQAATIVKAIEQLPDAQRALLDAVDFEFAKGRLFLATGEHAKAADIFKTILIQSPGLVRVRLELALALYLAEKDNAATHHFKLALAGDLPQNVSQNALRLLESIRNRRPVRYRFEMALAPNTNINTASDSNTVDIFGLPFMLNDDGRSKSGIGVFASGGVDWQSHLNDKTKMAASLQGQRTEYKGKSFDDTIVSANIGPIFTLGKVQWQVAATGFRRWFGASGFNTGIGGMLGATWRANRRWDISLKSSVQRLDYDLDPSQDGTLLGLSAQSVYGFDNRSYLSFGMGLNRHEARLSFQSYTAWQGRVGFYRELSRGVNITVTPEVTRRSFDDAHPFFGTKRSDITFGIGVDVSKRDIKLFGLTPVIRYRYVKNISNIGVYDFAQHRANIGFVKLF